MSITNNFLTAIDAAKCSCKSDHTGLHTRFDASNDNDNADSDRDNRNGSNGWRLQPLVWKQYFRKFTPQRFSSELHADNSRGRVSVRDCEQSCRSSRDNRHHQKYHHKLNHYLAICLLAVTSAPAVANDTYNTAAPTSSATGNVTNQAVQFQNNGAPSRQSYGGSVVCNGATMTLSPFIMGTETNPYDPEGWVASENMGVQLSFMVPLNGQTVEQCLAIARRQEEKMRLDYELVRALKCAELQRQGFTFRPGSRVEMLCHDVVPIVSITDEVIRIENP